MFNVMNDVKFKEILFTLFLKHMSHTKKTKFAPAERAPSESIVRDYYLIHDFELISKLFKVIPNIVLILNMERQAVFCNTALLLDLKDKGMDFILGKRPGEIINCIHAFNESGGCGTSDFCTVCGAVNAILETKNNLVKCEKECRITIKNENGIESIDIKVQTNILELNGQNFITFHITDISDIKRKNILERVFFHDIMNTVTIIQNLAELSIESKNDFNSNGYLDTLLLATHRLVEELKNQQELIKAENNDLVVNLFPISSNDLLETLKHQYENSQVAKDKKLILIDGSPNINFKSDVILLGRSLGNLLKNAFEAIEPNQVVTMGCSASDKIVTFYVHNPSYIPAEIQLQLFQRSFSTKGTGRGIGTYSIKLFIEKYLKGKVSVISSEESGTTFYISIPIV